ncbi:DUF3108 domain-containing protein [Sediminitomix flava]|uniref:Uncharacterized protein DUF3108 n=1 Tax=Sediminitomix flava TaxID=379075 RepID=A0A315ZBK9_SEDFL|nr:DUF3108 domain-containing protein [Sediminitomix flava]PWJ42931.1 uncharacterized protein DUF3108 [Sediminitomix flava]
MKKYSLFTFIVFISLGFNFIGSEAGRYPVDETIEFKNGEKYKYVISYAFWDAGEATIQLDKELAMVNDRPCYNVTVDGITTGIFGMTTIVKDKWQTFIDTAEIHPLKFYRDIKENSYTLKETTIFDHERKKATVEGNKKGKPYSGEYDIAKSSQDLISGYYYLRTLEYENFSKGDTIVMDAFFEDEAYEFKILYLGKEKVFSNFGRIESHIFSPIMPENALFRGVHPIKFWMTDDQYKVPIKVNAALIIGDVEINLVDYKKVYPEKLGKHKKKKKKKS